MKTIPIKKVRLLCQVLNFLLKVIYLSIMKKSKFNK